MVGRTISHYKVLERLGEGAMGIVYKAQDTRLNRVVALKFLSAPSIDEGLKKRFLREAQAAAQLHHPNICPIYDVGEAQGRVFFAMACLEGQPLAKLIEQGPLEPLQAIRIALQIAEGLEDAREHGVTHRDVTPNNIIVSSKGRVSILDFGLALLSGSSRLTKSGSTVGTPAYMSPQQAQGQDVDHRTDVWSLGVILFQMIAGRLPFEGEFQLAMMYGIVNERPPRIAELIPEAPPDLQAIVDRALAKELNDRYQSAGEVVADLSELQAQLEQASDERSLPERVRRKRRLGAGRFSGTSFSSQMPLVAGAGAAAVVVLILALWAIVGFDAGQDSGVPAEKHVAVLPFESFGESFEAQALSDGLVESITSSLSQLEQFEGQLLVVPLSELRSRGVDSAERARRLFGANLAITGSVQRLDDRVQLTANLVDAEQMRQLDSATLDFSIDQLSRLRDSAVGRVVAMLKIELRPLAEQAISAGDSDRPGAYRAYLEGRGYLHRWDVKGNIDRATESFQAAIAADPNYALAHAGLAEAYWRKANESNDQALAELAIESGERAVQLDDNLTVVHVKLGGIYRRSGRYEQATKSFRAALALDPASGEAYRGLASVYMEAGDDIQAEAAFQESVRLRPTDWLGYEALGSFYVRKGRHADAEAIYLKAIELAPNNAENHRNLALTYSRMGRVDDAKEQLEKALEIEPSARVFNSLGTIHYYEGDYRDAAAAFEMAIDLNSRDYLTWGNLGDAYYWADESRAKSGAAFERAIELGRARLAIVPDDYYLRSLLAEYWAKLGNSDEAVREIERMPRPELWSLSARRHVATAYELVGRRIQAIAQFRYVLEREPAVHRIKEDPFLAELWKDSSFQAMLTDLRIETALEP